MQGEMWPEDKTQLKEIELIYVVSWSTCMDGTFTPHT